MTDAACTPTQMIFVNLPSSDIARARAFYAGLDFTFDERFYDAGSLMVRVPDAIHLMLLDREKFASFPLARLPLRARSAHCSACRGTAPRQ